MEPKEEIITPGEFIRDELEERGWSQRDLAHILNRTPTVVSELIKGRRSITPQTARELSAAFGSSAEFWLNLEAAYQLKKVSTSVLDVERRAKMFAHAPIKEIEGRGWIKGSLDPIELENELCRFFKIDQINSESQVKIAARQSVAEDFLSAPQIAWCYRAIHLASAVHSAPFKKQNLLAALPDLRGLAQDPTLTRHVPRVLADAGVRFVIVEQLKSCKIDGAALWDGGVPILALSLRYGRVDWFWHTLLHEVSHLINEDSYQMIDIDLHSKEIPSWSIKVDLEERANRDASSTLIRPEDLDSFIKRVGPLYSKTRIIQFANRIKIHPAIVVGQLQHRGEIGWQANREMLVDIRAFVFGSAMADGFGYRPEVI